MDNVASANQSNQTETAGPSKLDETYDFGVVTTRIKEKTDLESYNPTKVRKSINDWEAGVSDAKQTCSPEKSLPSDPSKMKTKTTLLQAKSIGGRRASAETGSSPKQSATKYISRISEARACALKAKMQLGASKNTKREIVAEVLNAVERLVQLVRESESERGVSAKEKEKTSNQLNRGDKVEKDYSLEPEERQDLIQNTNRKLEEVMQMQRHEFDQQKRMSEATRRQLDEMKTQMTQMLSIQEKIQNEQKLPTNESSGECNSQLREIKSQIREFTNVQEEIRKEINTARNITLSYAEVLAGKSATHHAHPQNPKHTIIVSSTEEKDTSEEILEKVRKAVNAKGEAIQIDRMRKARNKKVVVSCNSEQNLEKITEKLQSSESLQAQKARNKDPLVIIRDLLAYNTDEDIITALKKQNGDTLAHIPEDEYRIIVKYRRKARNPHENHVILQVSPKVHRNLIAAGVVYIDIQKRTVKDQSPLIQCTKCLGFGHGKKTCTTTETLCSHCSGPHLRSECPSWISGDGPSCRNCNLAKMDTSNHNAFDSECPVKKRWDALARSSVAYC
ncbi:uncharacterized protein [Battus philenor]|uniref:uncharacterized protein n=1 Tax=Battus philenor TaxID=42288 RepID=UPI0035D0FD29